MRHRHVVLIPPPSCTTFSEDGPWLLKSGVGVEKVPQQNAFSSASMPLPVFRSRFD
jgi:hypothetical protein